MNAGLERFVEAQSGTWPAALGELQRGAKTSHWMWFVFPQLAGLGRSPTAQFYAIRGIAEARAYLAHPLLAARLREGTEAMLAWAGRRSPEAVLGAVDAAKLRSCLTLFEAAGGGDPFPRALDALYDGVRDRRTLALLADREGHDGP